MRQDIKVEMSPLKLLQYPIHHCLRMKMSAPYFKIMSKPWCKYDHISLTYTYSHLYSVIRLIYKKARSLWPFVFKHFPFHRLAGLNTKWASEWQIKVSWTFHDLLPGAYICCKMVTDCNICVGNTYMYKFHFLLAYLTPETILKH